MKKISTFLLALCMVFGLISTHAFAATSGLSLSKTDVKQGEEFTVSLTIPSIAEPMATIQLWIEFDKTKFEVTQYEPPQVTGGSRTYSTASEATAAGKISVSYEGDGGDNTADLSGGYTLSATVRALSDATVGSYEFNLTSTILQSLETDGYTPIDREPAGLVKTAQVDIVSQITGTVNVTDVTVPVKNATPHPAASNPLNTTVSNVSWAPNDAKFLANTAYTATITVTPDSGYAFANNAIFQINGNTATVADASGGAKTLSYTFPATANKELTALAIVGNTAVNVIPQGTQTVNLTAKGTYDDGTENGAETGVTWSIDPAVEGASISQSGVVSLEDNVSGNVVVKASKGSITATAHTIVVTKPVPELNSMIIGNISDIAVPILGESDNTHTYTVSGLDQYGNNISVGSPTWSIVGSPVGVSISAATVSVNDTAAAGDITIKVVSGSIEKTQVIKLTKEPSQAKTVEISSGFTTIAAPTVEAGGTKDGTAFDAIVKDQYGVPMSDQPVVWSIPTTTGVTIDPSSGVVTVTKEASATGSITVTATLGSISDTKNFAITKDTPKVAKIEISGDATITIPMSGSPNVRYYTATQTDQYGDSISESITWGTTGTLPTSVSQNDNSISVPVGAQTGMFKLTATVGSAVGNFDISITNKANTAVEITPNTTQVTYGDANFTLIATPTTTGTGTQTTTWSSSATSILEVNTATGEVTVKGVGSAVITADYSSDSHIGTDTIEITVEQKQLTWATDGIADDKTYDGTTTATAATQPTLNGIVGSDDVSVDTSSTSLNFANKNANTGIAVTATGYDISGTDVGNYLAPTQPTFDTADIGKKI